MCSLTLCDLSSELSRTVERFGGPEGLREVSWCRLCHCHCDYQDRQWRPDNRAMNWKYLLLSLPLLCPARSAEEEEEGRMCLGGRGWCDDPLSYPHHVLNTINSSHPVWPHLARSPQKGQKQHKAHPRHLFASQPACQTQESFILPRAGKNKKQQWRYILNSEDSRPEYQQVRLAETYIMADEFWLLY